MLGEELEEATIIVTKMIFPFKQPRFNILWVAYVLMVLMVISL